MVDYVKIRVSAGKGGDGHVSFRVQKGKPWGVADGGDGGDGGDTYLIASADLSTLSPYRFKKDFQADNGEVGGRNNRTGAAGDDLLLEVPVGTLVKNLSEEVIFDITKPEEKVLLVKGGKSGRGNAHLKHLIQKKREEGQKGIIRVFEKGEEGESIEVILELKLLADTGLVGFPNAGKSTLISKLTAARPKIADYPFTTLEPNLGVLTLGRKEIVIADIPGLIEGASQGRGLGKDFLRHLERNRLLLHLISLESSSALEDYQIINNELSSYSVRLKEIPQIVLLTKSDLVEAEKVKNIETVFKKKKIKTLTISAVGGLGLEELKKELAKRF